VILPCKGLDQEVRQNVNALLSQDYPDYEVIFVTADPADETLPVLKQLAGQFPQRKINFVTAGIDDRRGEKVNNLTQAIRKARPLSEVLVFTDSDARPHRTWLRELVPPLLNEQVGVCTGYRWYFPVSGNLGGALRSAWNASIATLLGEHNHNFCWGGSMAIRREVFDRVRVLNYWDSSISDDYSMASAVRAAGLRIFYEPRCLIGSYGTCGLGELLHWSTRQILLTKIYSRRMWQLAFVSQFPFVIGWYWALYRCVETAWRSGSPQDHLSAALAPVTFLIVVYVLGVLRGFLRFRAIRLIRHDSRKEIGRFAWCYLFLSPLVSTLTAYTLLASAFTSSLEWRGVRYELRSPHEVRVIRN
jgi:ceramide glucosyltransferase